VSQKAREDGKNEKKVLKNQPTVIEVLKKKKNAAPGKHNTIGLENKRI
jgi:hypothetical protein